MRDGKGQVVLEAALLMPLLMFTATVIWVYAQSLLWHQCARQALYASLFDERPRPMRCYGMTVATEQIVLRRSVPAWPSSLMHLGSQASLLSVTVRTSVQLGPRLRTRRITLITARKRPPRQALDDRLHALQQRFQQFPHANNFSKENDDAPSAQSL